MINLIGITKHMFVKKYIEIGNFYNLFSLCLSSNQKYIRNIYIVNIMRTGYVSILAHHFIPNTMLKLNLNIK